LKGDNTLKFTLTILLAAGSLLAQHPHGAPPTDAVKAYLNLTDSQLQALNDIRRQEGQAEGAAMQKMQTAQSSMDTMMRAGKPDAMTLGNLMIEIQNQNDSIAKTRAGFNAQAINALTPDQKAKLQALQAAAQLSSTIHEATGLFLLAPQPHSAGGMVTSGFGPGGHRGFHGPPPPPQAPAN
jgi:Spy/CpxP family protein refolding chaperone